MIAEKPEEKKDLGGAGHMPPGGMGGMPGGMM